jgi:hypothetical protein
MAQPELRFHARLTHWGGQLIVFDVWISLIFGLIAALFGGRFERFGVGIGGGYGVPDLIFLVAALFGLPSFLHGLRLLIGRERGASRWLLAFLGPLLISFAYILVPHTLDPCSNGLWTLTDQIGTSVQLCERFGSDIDIHTRFHYLWHILPTLPFVWIYRKVMPVRTAVR